MGVLSTSNWKSLERWRSNAFLVAGGLLLASPTHVGLELLMDVTLPSWVVALFVLPGLMASLVGVLGLYPQAADRAPKLALAGGVTVVIAGATLGVTFGWVLGDSLLSAVSGVVVSPPLAVLSIVFAATVTLGFIQFGVAILQSDAPSRTVGLLLLSFAVPWIVILAATPVYGSAFPGWLTLAIYGPLPLVMLAIGYALRMESTLTGEEDASADVATV